MSYAQNRPPYDAAKASINHLQGRFKKEWISDEITDECIHFTEEFGAALKDNKFTTSQIRNVFGEIKRIQMNGYSKNKTAFLLLRPKVAYAATRANKVGASSFKDVLSNAHEVVSSGTTEQQEKRFKNFCDFIEAILAYHKAAGGRD